MEIENGEGIDRKINQNEANGDIALSVVVRGQWKETFLSMQIFYMYT